nr:MAG TPA: hypothetical protein [Bacteriophage sp.]
MLHYRVIKCIIDNVVRHRLSYYFLQFIIIAGIINSFVPFCTARRAIKVVITYMGDSLRSSR